MSKRQIFVDNEKVDYVLKDSSSVIIFKMKNGSTKKVSAYEYKETIGQTGNLFLSSI